MALAAWLSECAYAHHLTTLAVVKTVVQQLTLTLLPATCYTPSTSLTTPLPCSLLLLLLLLQDCIALIETKPNGIIPTLDEQCLIGKATDDRYARELYKKCEGNTRFEVSNKMRVDHQFQIKHYAGAVTYSTVGIIEKNRDTLAQEVSHLFRYLSDGYVSNSYIVLCNSSCTCVVPLPLSLLSVLWFGAAALLGWCLQPYSAYTAVALLVVFTLSVVILLHALLPTLLCNVVLYCISH
jgi:Myosin head (motor domain)